MTEYDAQDTRIEAILGAENESLNFNQAVRKFYDHLRKRFQLPFDVTGIEDFRWEERYIFGSGNSKEYQKLQEVQPSYKDTFELLVVEENIISEWMGYQEEDLAGHVRRKSDGKEFYLGLAEIEAVDKESENHQLLDDYAVWFVNNR
jgi:hypothetical protein